MRSSIMLRAAAVAALVAATACGPRGWSSTNWTMEASFAGELTVDAVQTRRIVNQCQEYNPIIGRCGERMPWQAYIPVTMLLHATISYLLPPRARVIWQAATAGVEGHTIYYNAIVPDNSTAARR